MKRREKKRNTFLRGIGARVSKIFGTQPPRSPTSPGRLDAEAAQPRVPVVTTTTTDDKVIITKVEEEDEDVPEDVNKDDIIKMLDFVSESTEQIVYKAVGIRGTISSVDEVKGKQELQNSWRSLRKVVNALKGTMDNLTQVEEVLKSAPEIQPEKPSDEATSSPTPVPLASAPIAVDEADADDTDDKPTTDHTSGDPMDAKGDEAEKKEETKYDKPLVGLNDSLDNVEDFDERKPSVSLMEAIEKTLNGEHSISVKKDSSDKEASGDAEAPAEAKQESEPSKVELSEQVKEEAESADLKSAPEQNADKKEEKNDKDDVQISQETAKEKDKTEKVTPETKQGIDEEESSKTTDQNTEL